MEWVIVSDLRILDDWGPERLNAAQRRDLMEIVEDRYEAGSPANCPLTPGMM